MDDKWSISHFNGFHSIFENPCHTNTRQLEELQQSSKANRADGRPHAPLLTGRHGSLLTVGVTVDRSPAVTVTVRRPSLAAPPAVTGSSRRPSLAAPICIHGDELRREHAAADGPAICRRPAARGRRRSPARRHDDTCARSATPRR